MRRRAVPDGALRIDFSRDAGDLESAIRSAIVNVSVPRCVVDRVEIEVIALVKKVKSEPRILD